MNIQQLINQMHRAQIEKLILAWFFKKFPVIYGILRFLTVSIRAYEPYFKLINLVHTVVPYSLSLR
jgi:hypothetical protein